MTTKKQKITAVLALAIAFGLGMTVMCGCSYFTQEKVAEIHKTVGTILDIAYTSGGAVLVEQKIDQLVADGKITAQQGEMLKEASRRSYEALQAKLAELSVKDVAVEVSVKMKPGWELAFRPGFSFQQKWTIPHAVIRAQRSFWRRTVFLTIRGMRPGPAFAQHAPQFREQRRIYEQVDAGNAPISFLHNFLKYRSAGFA